jgi:cytoskeletal protein CcmA (bactofilin family)
MPANPDRVPVTCPHCGHEQPEPREAFSTVCKKCRRHFRLQEVHSATPPAPLPATETKQVTCFECGAHLDVAATAESTMCKRCSRYVDLKDYRITSGISKNFKTRGSFIVEPKGYVFNTEAWVGEAVIKGRFLGKLHAERALTIHSTAEIKGHFSAGCLVIPASQHFRWPDLIEVQSAEIQGELVANLRATRTITLGPAARMFGNITATHLVVEPGAVLVGRLQVGPLPAAKSPGPP